MQQTLLTEAVTMPSPAPRPAREHSRALPRSRRLNYQPGLKHPTSVCRGKHLAYTCSLALLAGVTRHVHSIRYIGFECGVGWVRFRLCLYSACACSLALLGCVTGRVHRSGRRRSNALQRVSNGAPEGRLLQHEGRHMAAGYPAQLAARPVVRLHRCNVLLNMQGRLKGTDWVYAAADQ